MGAGAPQPRRGRHRPASPSPTSSTTGLPGCSTSWPRTLKDGSYRPLPARRVFIPKPGRRSGGRCRSRGPRPDRAGGREDRARADLRGRLLAVLVRVPAAGASAHDALQVLLDEAWRGRRWVVETDIANCFEAIPHDRLMPAVEERIVDRQLLEAPARVVARRGDGGRHGQARRHGTPQGGVISPLLCNVYLHRLDRQWQTAGAGCSSATPTIWSRCARTGEEAERALAALPAMLAELGLEPKQAKTRIVHLREGGEGFDFLGFHHRWVRARTRVPPRHLPRPLALTQGDAARPRPHPRTHGAGAAALAGRRGRAGPQPVPARLGGLLPLRQLGPSLRPDHTLRGSPARALRGASATSDPEATAGSWSPTSRRTARA